jgi:hypothetical protein
MANWVKVDDAPSAARYLASVHECWEIGPEGLAIDLRLITDPRAGLDPYMVRSAISPMVECEAVDHARERAIRMMEAAVNDKLDGKDAAEPPQQESLSKAAP